MTSGVLIDATQIDLVEDYDLAMQFSYVEFPLENAMLLSCKKDLTSHFILDPYSCFHYYLTRHFSFVNDYISLRYLYQATVIKCRGCYAKSVRNIMKSFTVYLK